MGSNKKTPKVSISGARFESYSKSFGEIQPHQIVCWWCTKQNCTNNMFAN